MYSKQNNSPEILFLFPSFKEMILIDFIIDYHLGAAYILAYLKKMDICAKQFIQREPVDLPALVEKIIDQKPKIVGFTCYETNYYFIKLISQALKKKNSSLIFIAGGPTATFSDELVMQDNPAIDICVRGEGEYTVYELVTQLKKSHDVSKIEGITYRLSGKIIRTQDRPLITNGHKGQELDIVPSPYLSSIFPIEE